MKDNKAEITRLTTYVEKIRLQIASVSSPEKKAFLERDLKKTISRMEKIK
jgi:hypothetical protein